MKSLIDTHTFLWFITDASELSLTAKTSLLDEEHQIWVSMASFWEISIKNSLGKLRLEIDYGALLNEVNKNGFQLLPINFEHTVTINTLPFHHRDPFDRMIIAQAIVENLDVIGVDKIFDEYLNSQKIKRVW